MGGIGGIRPPVFYPPPIYFPPPFYGGYWGAWGYYDDDWMWGIAVGTTVAAVAVTAAAEDDDDEEEDDEEENADDGDPEGDVAPITTTTLTSGTTATALEGRLPCNPVIKEQDSMTYYLCGDQHFVLAYGGTGPVYIPVPAP
jgi:hypothetical protein